jgi:hypothetical protein
MRAFFLIVAAGMIGIVHGATYQPKAGNLMTRWSAEVSPTNALPEYPRPQMVRARWLNLNGLWEFSTAQEGEMPPFGKTLPERILVPYPVESPLSGLMRREDRMWYRRTFAVPQDWGGQHVLLHFGAVTWRAAVYVNGKPVGNHQGGYGAFTFDITAALKPGENEVIVNAFNPADLGDQPVGKQTRMPRGYWYTASSGIWQTVWLEAVPAAHIARLDMTPDPEHGTLRLTVRGEGTSDQTVEAVASTGGIVVGQAKGSVGQEFVISVPNAHLWSPDDPFLYDLTVRLKNGASEIDSVTGYFGMRSIAVGKVNGISRPLLNGKFVFLLGPLDQGFWPDGNYTAPTDEALRFDLEQEKKCGYNLVRKHIKVEPARWYYWADKLGIAVLQDMPSMPPHGLLPDLTERKGRNEQTPEVKRVYETEFLEMIDQLRSSPAIIAWIEFNEGWGEYSDRGEVGRLARWVKGYDPQRFLIADTGSGRGDAGDAIDWHTYPGPGSPPPLEGSFAGQGEFGGVGLAIKDHTWRPVNRDQDAAANYTARYVDMLHRVKELMYSPGLSYALFTQITDVENELNGLFTYDRAVFKGDLAAIRQANVEAVEASGRAVMPLTDSFRDDFAADSGKWTAQGGSWKASEGACVASSGISLTPTNFNNLSCGVDVTLPAGGEAGLVFRSAGDDRGPAYYAGISAGGKVAVSYRDASGWTSFKEAALPVEAGRKYRLRVGACGGTIRVYVDDMAVPKLEASDFRSLNGAAGLRVVSGEARFGGFVADDPFLRLKPMSFPRFVIHDSRKEDVVRIDDNVNRTDDALWESVPGLADSRGVSFASARMPGFYLRDQGGRIVYARDDGSPDFAKEVTWIAGPGLADPNAGMRSYESFSHPGEYLRHRGGLLFRQTCATDGDKADATFFPVK